MMHPHVREMPLFVWLLQKADQLRRRFFSGLFVILLDRVGIKCSIFLSTGAMNASANVIHHFPSQVSAALTESPQCGLLRSLVLTW
jgi:hypothetical protein